MSKHLEEFVEKYTGSKINVNVTSVQSAMGTYTFIVSTDAEWINHVRVAISQLSSIRVNDTCTVTFRGLLCKYNLLSLFKQASMATICESFIDLILLSFLQIRNL